MDQLCPHAGAEAIKRMSLFKGVRQEQGNCFHIFSVTKEFSNVDMKKGWKPIICSAKKKEKGKVLFFSTIQVADILAKSENCI